MRPRCGIKAEHGTECQKQTKGAMRSDELEKDAPHMENNMSIYEAIIRDDKMRHTRETWAPCEKMTCPGLSTTLSVSCLMWD